MSGETEIECLLQIIEKSRDLDPELLTQAVTRDGALIPWSEVSEERLPRPDILRDMHREQAMGALYSAGAVSSERLK